MTYVTNDKGKGANKCRDQRNAEKYARCQKHRRNRHCENVIIYMSCHWKLSHYSQLYSQESPGDMKKS